MHRDRESPSMVQVESCDRDIFGLARLRIDDGIAKMPESGLPPLHGDFVVTHSRLEKGIPN